MDGYGARCPSTCAAVEWASAVSGSDDHAHALMPQLKRYEHCFVTDLTIHCEGSVAHFWALLARLCRA